MTIEGLVRTIVEAIVDDKDKVRINVIETERTVVIEIAIAKMDIGKVIGKDGRIIQSIRIIVSATTYKKCVLDVVDNI